MCRCGLSGGKLQWGVCLLYEPKLSQAGPSTPICHLPKPGCSQFVQSRSDGAQMAPKKYQLSSPTACICPKYHSLSLVCAKRSDMITWIQYSCCLIHVRNFTLEQSSIQTRNRLQRDIICIKFSHPPVYIPETPYAAAFSGLALDKALE